MWGRTDDLQVKIHAETKRWRPNDSRPGTPSPLYNTPWTATSGTQILRGWTLPMLRMLRVTVTSPLGVWTHILGSDQCIRSQGHHRYLNVKIDNRSNSPTSFSSGARQKRSNVLTFLPLVKDRTTPPTTPQVATKSRLLFLWFPVPFTFPNSPNPDFYAPSGRNMSNWILQGWG